MWQKHRGEYHFLVGDVDRAQDGDVVIFLWRESDPVPNVDIDLAVKMGVAKHRNGPTGVLAKNGNSLVQFRRSSTRFEDSIVE